jgi:hypothetical protein
MTNSARLALRIVLGERERARGSDCGHIIYGRFATAYCASSRAAWWQTHSEIRLLFLTYIYTHSLGCWDSMAGRTPPQNMRQPQRLQKPSAKVQYNDSQDNPQQYTQTEAKAKRLISGYPNRIQHPISTFPSTGRIFASLQRRRRRDIKRPFLHPRNPPLQDPRLERSQTQSRQSIDTLQVLRPPPIFHSPL